MRFLIIDDHSLFRTALSVIVCQLGSDVEVVEANDLDEAFEVLKQEDRRSLSMTRLRLRGLTGAKDHFLLTATVQNLKRLVQLTPIPPPRTMIA